MVPVGHALSEVFGGHSHDAADQVDEVLEADAQGRRALYISLALLAVTALLQAVVVVFADRWRCSVTRCTTSPTR